MATFGTEWTVDVVAGLLCFSTYIYRNLLVPGDLSCVFAEYLLCLLYYVLEAQAVYCRWR